MKNAQTSEMLRIMRAAQRQPRLRKFNLDKFFIDFEKRFHRNFARGMSRFDKNDQWDKADKVYAKDVGKNS